MWELNKIDNEIINVNCFNQTNMQDYEEHYKDNKMHKA